MFRNLGPLNQRKLNVKIREVYGDKFVDWYDFAHHLAASGMNRARICKQFEALGVSISQARLSCWIANRARIDRAEARKQAENNAA